MFYAVGWWDVLGPFCVCPCHKFEYNSTQKTCGGRRASRFWRMRLSSCSSSSAVSSILRSVRSSISSSPVSSSMVCGSVVPSPWSVPTSNSESSTSSYRDYSYSYYNPLRRRCHFRANAIPTSTTTATGSIIHGRRWSSSSSSTSTTTTTKTVDGGLDASITERLSQFGVDSTFHEDVVKSLASVLGNSITTTTLDQFGKEGIQALVHAIEQEQLKQQRQHPNRPVQKEIVISIPHHRTEFSLLWRQGQSLMELAHSHEVLQEYIEGTCGGTMACCSCQVYLLDPTTYAALGGPPTTNEQDMLDLAYDPKDNASRLACQVYLTPEALTMESKLVITIPEGVNNVW
jgi:ferredoxin